jgi:ABC-type nitrate/sulfonate/bicarbonate transport system substrate-binding protein
MKRVDLGLFSANTPLLLASSRGWFGDAGIEVIRHQVESSEDQFRGLVAGRFPLVLTAFDNLLNYSSNESNPAGRVLDLRVLRAVDGGMNLSLVASGGIRNASDLAGRTLSVDAPDSGFAYVAYSALRHAGLEKGKDYEVVHHGGVMHRFERLLVGAADATLLSNGFEIMAARAGLTVIAGPRDLSAPYLGAVFAAVAGWAEEHANEVDAFLNVYGRAEAEVLSGAADAELVGAIAAARGVDQSVAEQLLNAERSRFGLIPGGKVDPDAAESVARLRADNDGFEPTADVSGLLRRLTPRS